MLIVFFGNSIFSYISLKNQGFCLLVLFWQAVDLAGPKLTTHSLGEQFQSQFS